MIIIPANTTLIGEIRSSGQLRFDGRVDGNAEIDGLILLTHECVWKGKITADVIIVEGDFEGELIAREKIEIHTYASVTADIVTPKMSIAYGANVSGDLRMKKPETALLVNKSAMEAAAATADLARQDIEQVPQKRVAGE